MKEVSAKLLECQAERDSYALRLEQLAPNDLLDNPEARTENQGVLQKHLQHIADLETEVSRLKKVSAFPPQRWSCQSRGRKQYKQVDEACLQQYIPFNMKQD